MGIIVQNLAGGFESIQRWHADIENYDVRFKVSDFLHGLAAVSSFTADFPAGVRCQQSADTATNDFMIISHKNTERHKTPRTVANQCSRICPVRCERMAIRWGLCESRTYCTPVITNQLNCTAGVKPRQFD